MKNVSLNECGWWNLLTGIGYQVINTALGLVLPYLFITSFGSETNGVLNSISQLFVYINLLEAGVGAATVQALYKPLLNKDTFGANRIMSATNKYYTRTGVIYACLVVILAGVYPIAVSTGLPFWTVFGVIVLEGAGSVCRFLFQGKYTLLLKAAGQSYVLNCVTLAASVLRNAGKIIAIAMGCDVVCVQAIAFVVSLVQTAVIIAYAKRRYSWIKFQETPDYGAIKQKNAVLLQEVSWLIFNHTDILVLSIVAQNLKLVSVYSVYALVFEAIQNVVDTANKSLQYKMGFAWQNSVEALRVYLGRYEKFYFFLAYSLLSVTYILTPTFMKIYVGSVDDINYMIAYLPELFLTMKLLYMVRQLHMQVIGAVGHFKTTQHISVKEMFLNLILSVLLAFKLSIYGVLIGSICALVYSAWAYTRYTNQNILGIKGKESLVTMCLNVVLATFCCVFGRSVLPSANTLFELVLIAIPVTLCVVVFFGALNFALNKCGEEGIRT